MSGDNVIWKKYKVEQVLYGYSLKVLLWNMSYLLLFKIMITVFEAPSTQGWKSVMNTTLPCSFCCQWYCQVGKNINSLFCCLEDQRKNSQHADTVNAEDSTTVKGTSHFYLFISLAYFLFSLTSILVIK